MNNLPEAERSKQTGEGEVSHEVRRARTLQRKAAQAPKVIERKRRQRRNSQLLKKAMVEPSSGHRSPRPNRHMSRRKTKGAAVNAQ